MSSEKISKSRNLEDGFTGLPGKRLSLTDVFAKAGLTTAGHGHRVAGKAGHANPEQQYWQWLMQDYEKICKMLPPPGAFKTASRRGARRDAQHPYADLIWDAEKLHRAALPCLQHLLLARSATIELAFLWGRLCFTAASDLAARQHSDAPRPSPDKIKRRGPLKWYLHWRQFYARKGLTVHRANADFLRIAFGIATGLRPAPPGFAPAWFRGALCQGHNKSLKQALPHAFKRIQKLHLTPLLLGSSPEEDPKIPPVGLAAYQAAEKPHHGAHR